MKKTKRKKTGSMWSKAVSAVLSLCLICSLLVGADAAVWAAESGKLINGALTDSTEGWTVAGITPASTGSEDEGYWCTTDTEGGYLSIWNKTDADKEFSMTQTIENAPEGIYTAKIAAVGNGDKGAGKSLDHLTLKVVNTTQNTEVSAKIVTDGWDNWGSVTVTDTLDIAEGDSVTITISGTMVAGKEEWYGLKNVVFDAQSAVEAPINVEKVSGLSKDFIHGVDVSTYLSEIQSGAKYYDENGEEKNMFEIFRDGGVNYVRLRVWNCPFRVDENGDYIYVDDAGTEYTADQVTTTQSEEGYNVYTLKEGGTEVYREGYGAGNCDIDTAVATGKIATKYGMKVLIDFHYSDFWADPAKYKVPKAWAGMTVAEKAEALSSYTTECLQKLKDAGVDVGMVQIGNEINNGMAGEKNMDDICTLLKAGSAAVRAIDPDILIAVHYADPHKSGYQLNKAKALDAAGVDYDVFATSFYSFWHGSPENLTSVLKSIASAYNKKVMVAEVSYCSTLKDGDGAANVVNSKTSPLDYSIDAEGQAAAVRNAIAAVSAVGEAGIGTFYWEPAWIPVQNYENAEDQEVVLASNIDKWEKYGSGWASVYSGSEGDDYDPGVDTDKSTHGSQWDNQAMFDFDGKALPSINVYKWVYTGAEGPIRVSTIDTASAVMNYKEVPELPTAVNVHLNDGNIVENVAVTWNEAQVEALKTADFGEYTIDGLLGEFTYESKGEDLTIPEGTYTTTCSVTVTGTNHALDPGFEDGGSAWTLTNTANAGGPKVKNDGAGGNARSGKCYYDAWSADPLDFTVEQTISKDETVPNKTYTLYAFYQGTNVAEISEDGCLFAEVTYKNGMTETYKAEIQIPNTWKQFYQAKINHIIVNDYVKDIKIGTRMACTGNASGAWVVIDDINLMEADALTEEQAAHIVSVDKSELQTAVEAADALQQEKDLYTAATWTVLEEKLAAAKAVLGKADATAQQTADAKAELTAAQEALKTVAKENAEKEAAKLAQAKSDAQEALTQVQTTLNNYKEEDYTAEGWSAVQTAIAGMNAVLSKEDAAAEEITAAKDALNEAFKKLEDAKKNPGDQTPGGQTPGGQTPGGQTPGGQTPGGQTPTDQNSGSQNPQVKVSGIKFAAKKLRIAAGKSVVLKPEIAPSNAADKAIEWKSSNNKYAAVKNGKVTTKRAGAGKSVTITAAAKDGSGVKASIKIDIMKHAVTKIGLKAKSTVKAGKKLTIKADVKTNGKKANLWRHTKH